MIRAGLRDHRRAGVRDCQRGGVWAGGRRNADRQVPGDELVYEAAQEATHKATHDAACERWCHCSR